MNSQDLEDVRKQAEYDRLMSSARVSRMRGDYAQAAESVRRALNVRPDDPDALEFAADVLAARGEIEKAAEVYKGIFSADPSRASAEEKFAKMTIAIAEGRRQQDLLRQMIENPAKFCTPPRSPVIAAILSAAPGFGQIYGGQFVKGLVLFVSVMTFWFFFYLAAPDVSFYPESQRTLKFFHNMSAMGIVFALIAVSLHVYAFVDAPVYASKMNEAEAKRLAEPE